MKPSIVLAYNGTLKSDEFEFMYTFAGALEVLTSVDVIWDDVEEIEKNIIGNESYYANHVERCIVVFLKTHGKDFAYQQTIYDRIRKLFPDVGIVWVWAEGGADLDTVCAQSVRYLGWENCAPLRFTGPDAPMEHGKFFKELHALISFCLEDNTAAIEKYNEDTALKAGRTRYWDNHTLDVAYTGAKAMNRKHVVEELLKLYRTNDFRPPDITEEEWNPEEEGPEEEPFATGN